MPSRTSSHAVLLLSLVWIACQPGEEKDSVAPADVRVTGGVTPGERVTGSRTLQATAADDSGTIVRMEFSITGRPVCSDDVAKGSGETFSCSWDSSATSPGSHQLLATAYDAAGNSASSEPLSFTIPVNALPSVSRMSASSSSLDEGSSTILSVTASDPDGDPLTYVWTQSPVVPAGTFGTEAGAARTWTAPILSQHTRFTLKVTVSDGRGGTAEATVEVDVANVPALNRAPVLDQTIMQVPVHLPSYAADIQPLWSPTCTTCHSGSGAPGGLNLEASSSHALLVNRNGSAACGTFARVVPEQPDESLLVQKISGDGCGGRMPQLDTSYFDRNPGELTRIRSWILAGARND